MTLEVVFGVLVVFTGMAMGSYFGTLAQRYASAVPMSEGRSRCDGCKRQLSFWDTIPILSYLRLKGRCAVCRHPIDVSHNIAEWGGAIIGLAALVIADPPRSLAIVCLGYLLIAITIIDLKTLRIPNLLTMGVCALSVLRLFLSPQISLIAGLVAAFATFGILQGLRIYLHRSKGREALGFGDVKLASSLALWLGVATPWMMAGAALLGLVSALFIARNREVQPFGPMLAASAFTLCVTLELGLWPMTGRA